jgi:4-carboxymuconolactone decarboxylase
MRSQSLVLGILVTCVAGTAGQNARPADIHPESLSRLPPLQRESLDAEGKRVWDALASSSSGTLSKFGPAPVTMYSPKAAEPIQALNQYLRNSVVGRRSFELASLIAAREFDQQYEWSGHEPAAVAAGLEQAVIDVVKFNRPVDGLSEKDATAIRLGRALFREHVVAPELWAKAVQVYGQQGAVELTMIMADYAMVGFILTAVDQHLPPERKALLPNLGR